MSTKNFASYGDLETLFASIQGKATPISYADWLLLTPQQQETGNWLVTGVPGANLSSRVLALESNVASLDSEKADTDIVASDFNAGTSYTAGNYCVYNGKFYKFKNNHSGAWNAADVDEIKIAGELSGLKSGLIKVVSGTETFTDVAANTSNHLTIYPQGLKVAHVVACLDADGVMTNTSCGIKDITTNSVKIYARNNGSTAATIKVNWVAFGS